MSGTAPYAYARASQISPAALAAAGGPTALGTLRARGLERKVFRSSPLASRRGGPG